MKKRTKGLIGCILLVSMLFTGCARKENTQADFQAPELLPAAGVASDICEVIRQDYVLQRLQDAYVSAYVEELYFTVDGVIGEVFVNAGDSVKKGDPLVVLNLDSEREEYETLMESVERTRTSNDYANRLLEIDISILEVERQSLIAKGADKNALALNALDIEQAKLNLQQTKQLQEISLEPSLRKLEILKTALENDTVYAPFDGVIARAIEIGKGSGVKAYDTVLCLADNTRMLITTEYISEANIKGAHAVYALIGDSRYSIEYTPMPQSEYLSKLLSGQDVYTSFTITGPEGWEKTIEPGLYAAIIFENNFVPDALLIPSNAVLSDSDGKYVYIVGEHGERIKRTIRVRTSVNSIYTQVLEGLEEGERIYVTDK